MALTVACNALGYFTIDARRHARERLPHTTYLTSSYYRIWILALERQLQDAGVLSPAELAGGAVSVPPDAAARRLAPDRVAAMLASGGPVARPASAPARFVPGQWVRLRNHQPEGHTRLPAYARDKTGVIEHVHGVHVYPDTNAHDGGEAPQWVYTVVFDAATLWGADADPDLSVTIDAFEPYLDPA